MLSYIYINLEYYGICKYTEEFYMNQLKYAVMVWMLLMVAAHADVVMDDFTDNRINYAPGVAEEDLGYLYVYGEDGGTVSPAEEDLETLTGSVALTIIKPADEDPLYPSAGFGMNFKDPKGNLNISAFDGVYITYTGASVIGSGMTLQLVLDDGGEDGEEWMCAIPAGSSTLECLWADFTQLDWVDPKETAIPFATLKGLQVSIKGSGAGSAAITITEVGFLGDAPVSSSVVVSSSSEPVSSSTVVSSSSEPISSSTVVSSSAASGSVVMDDFTDNRINYAPGVAEEDLGYLYVYGEDGGTVSPAEEDLETLTGSVALTIIKPADDDPLYPSAGFGMNFKDPKGNLNISAFDGVYITYTGASVIGSGMTLQLVLDDGGEDGEEWMCAIPVGSATLECLWADFTQVDWVDPKETAIPFATLKGLQVSIKGSGAGSAAITITEVGFLGDAPVSSSVVVSSSSEPVSSSTVVSSSSEPISSSTVVSSSAASGSVVEDFLEHQVNLAPGKEGEEGYWYVYADKSGSATNPATAAALENAFGVGSLAVTLSVEGSTEQYPYAGVGFDFIDNGDAADPDKETVSLTAYTGIEVTYTASASGIVMEMADARVSDGTEYKVSLPTGANTAVFYWNDFTQPSHASTPAKGQRPIPLSAVTGFKFVNKVKNTSKTITFTNIRLVTSAPPTSSSSEWNSSSVGTSSSATSSDIGTSSSAGISSSAAACVPGAYLKGTDDHDCDGITNYYDDFDGNGVPNFMEDDAKNGILNYLDPTWIYFGQGGTTSIARAFVTHSWQLQMDRNVVSLQVPQSGNYTVDVYSLTGSLIATVHKGVLHGNAALQWNGAALPAGIYLVRVQGVHLDYSQRIELK
jgi:hypothetical protein